MRGGTGPPARGFNPFGQGRKSLEGGRRPPRGGLGRSRAACSWWPARPSTPPARPPSSAAPRRLGRTPVIACQSFDDASGHQVFFKCENLQRAGAFKIRGALNKLTTLTAAERARGVIAFSSGNHAQGVALAARMVGTTAVVCMPKD